MHKQVRAENTFLLALDGDVDFQPEAIIKLVDLMKRNPDVGASCGRIHPIGSGLHFKKLFSNLPQVFTLFFS